MSDQEVIARIEQEMAADTPLESVTPSLIFNSNEEQIQQVRDAVETTLNGTGFTELKNLLDGQEFQTYYATNRKAIFIRARSGALLQKRVSQDIANRIGIMAGSLGRNILVVETNARGLLPFSDFADLDDSFLVITLPSSNRVQRSVAIGNEFALDGSLSILAADRDVFAEDTASVVTSSEVVVAHRATDRVAHLRINPFAVDGNKIECDPAGQRSGIFKALLQSIFENLGLSGGGASGKGLENLRNQIETIELFSKIGDFATPRTGEIQARLEREIADSAASVDRLRDQLINALREQNDKTDEIEALKTADVTIDRNQAVEIFKHLITIRKLTGVKSVEIVGSTDPSLKIIMNPFVLKRGRNKYLFNNLGFKVKITNGKNLNMKWLYFEQISGEYPHSPHPHVSTGGSTCWGQAGQHLNGAAERGDWTTVITLIMGWASKYNGGSPHVALSNFPTTHLEPGWHPSLPSGVS